MLKPTRISHQIVHDLSPLLLCICRTAPKISICWSNNKHISWITIVCIHDWSFNKQVTNLWTGGIIFLPLLMWQTVLIKSQRYFKEILLHTTINSVILKSLTVYGLGSISSFNSKLFDLAACDLVQPTHDTQRTDFIQVFIKICRDKGSDVSQNNLLFFQIVVIISLIPMWQYIFWNEFWCWRISSCVTWRNTVQLLSFIIGKWKRITLIY